MSEVLTAVRSAWTSFLNLLQSWRGSAYLGVGALFYLFFLLLTLPAYWADALAGRLSHQRLHILETQGSFWKGEGKLVIQVGGQSQPVLPIAWDLQLWRLLTGKLQITLQSRASSLPMQATIRLGYHQLTIQDADLTVPVTLIGSLVPALELVGPSGRLQLLSPRAQLSPAGLDGQIEITWLDAGTRLGSLDEVGDYRLTVNGHGPVADLRVETLRGDVQMTATGTWQATGDGLAQLQGVIIPGSRAQSLRPLLSTLNVQENDGQYSWSQNVRLPLARWLGVAS